MQFCVLKCENSVCWISDQDLPSLDGGTPGQPLFSILPQMHNANVSLYTKFQLSLIIQNQRLAIFVIFFYIEICLAENILSKSRCKNKNRMALILDDQKKLKFGI